MSFLYHNIKTCFNSYNVYNNFQQFFNILNFSKNSQKNFLFNQLFINALIASN